ncbi:hypothetical protein K439DRAFT_1519334 [Ramaria rubella]|nr:hypothetical protein K439DRAFT_1519334 [Ramaria rubella]
MQTRRDSTTVEQQHTPRSPAVEPSFENDGQGVNDSSLHIPMQTRRVSMIADQRDALTSPTGRNQQCDRVVAFPNNFRPSSQDDGHVRVIQDQGRSPQPRSVTREVSSTAVVGTDLPVSKSQWCNLRVTCSLVKASRTEDSEKSPDSYLGSECDNSVALSSNGTPYSGGVHSRQDEAMDKSPWRTPVQTHHVSTNPKIDPDLQVRPAAGSPNQHDIRVTSSFGGTPSNDGVRGNKDEAMDNSPWPAPVQTQIVSTCRQIENSPRSSIACSLNVRNTVVALDSDGTSWLCNVSEPVNQGMSALPYTPRWSARREGRMGEGQKMDDSPPFEVHVQQYISSAKTDKRADSPSPASYLHDIIFHDVATLLESEAARSSIKNSDKHPSTHVMQDPSLALTTVLVPSCSEAGKDSQSLSFNVSVPEGCHVGSSTSNLTEMSDGLLEQGGIVADRNVPSTGRGSKPAVTAIEANVAVSSSYRARRDTSVASSDEVVSLTSSAVELNVRDSDECPSLPVDASRNISFMVNGRIKNAPTSLIIRAQRDTSVASPDVSFPFISSAVELEARDPAKHLSLAIENVSVSRLKEDVPPKCGSLNVLFEDRRDSTSHVTGDAYSYFWS